MELTNTVDRLELHLNDYTDQFEELLIVKFNADFRFSGDKSIDQKSFFVTFNKDGKIESFPDIKFNSKSPMRYVSLGKVVEKIMSYEGNRAKKTYDEAMNIAKMYNSEKDNLINNKNYESLQSKRLKLTSIINDKTAKFKRSRNLEKKNCRRDELIALEEELRNLCDKEISPIEQELNHLELKKRKAISELVM